MLNTLIKMGEALTSKDIYEILLQGIMFDTLAYHMANVNISLMKAYLEMCDTEREDAEKPHLQTLGHVEAEQYMRGHFFMKLGREDTDSGEFNWPDSLELDSNARYPKTLLREVATCLAQEYKSTERQLQRYIQEKEQTNA